MIFSSLGVWRTHSGFQSEKVPLLSSKKVNNWNEEKQRLHISDVHCAVGWHLVCVQVNWESPEPSHIRHRAAWNNVSYLLALRESLTPVCACFRSCFIRSTTNLVGAMLFFRLINGWQFQLLAYNLAAEFATAWEIVGLVCFAAAACAATPGTKTITPTYAKNPGLFCNRSCLFTLGLTYLFSPG